MINTQNLTPKQLSAFTAIVISVSVALGIFFLTSSWKNGVGSLIIVFAVSYILIQITIEKFVNRKIKLIYKFIHQTKPPGKKKFISNTFCQKKVLTKCARTWKDGEINKWKKLNCFARTKPSGKNFCRIFPMSLRHPFSLSRVMWIPC